MQTRWLVGAGAGAVMAGAIALLGRAALPDDLPPAAHVPGEMNLRHEVFYAVLEGCYEDGLANDAVDRILAPDPATGRPMHFVPKCPVCMPALDAFRLYRGRPIPVFRGGDRGTFGPGLDAFLTRRLASEVMKERLDVLHTLMVRWVGRRLDARRGTPEERAEWNQRLQELAKKGMAMLQAVQEEGRAGAYTGMSTCAICDGASRCGK